MRHSASKHFARAGRAAQCLLFTTVMMACGESTAPNGTTAVDSLTALPRTLAPVERQAVDAGNAFALDLFKQAVANPSPDERNTLLSPLSVSMALGLTMNGAAGTTLAEMQQVLGWGTRSRNEINAAYRDLRTLLPSLDSTVTVGIANGIWAARGAALDAGFVTEARDFFGAPVAVANSPEAMFDAVNSWANSATRGMLPRVLVQPPPDNLRMLIANAVYFNGTWRDRFDPAKTITDAPFTLGSGAVVKTPMMTRTGGFNAAHVDLGLERLALAAEVPYGNGAYSMLLLMPQSGSIQSLVQRLDTARLGTIVRSLRPGGAAMLGIPRFTLTSSRELSRDLITLGMSRAFSRGAEFPRLVTNEATQIGFVQHMVKVEVNERGTRAAGVTVVGIVVVSVPASYVFDKPFVFAIRERFTGTILFIGVVHDPR